MGILRKIAQRGPRLTLAAVLRRLLRRMESPKIVRPIEVEYDDCLRWILDTVPGWLGRGNITAMEHAIRHLPPGTAIVEIGSFAGLSACVLTQLKGRHQCRAPLFTCDPWDHWPLRGTGDLIQGSATVTRAAFRTFVLESFRRHTRFYCSHDLPATIETESADFFTQWRAGAKVRDVFDRETQLGGPIGFCYIDGEHSLESARRDFLNADQSLAPGGFILLDDTAHSNPWTAPLVIDEILPRQDYRLISAAPNYFFEKVPGSAESNPG